MDDTESVYALLAVIANPVESKKRLDSLTSAAAALTALRNEAKGFADAALADKQKAEAARDAAQNQFLKNAAAAEERERQAAVSLKKSDDAFKEQEGRKSQIDKEHAALVIGKQQLAKQEGDFKKREADLAVAEARAAALEEKHEAALERMRAAMVAPPDPVPVPPPPPPPEPIVPPPPPPVPIPPPPPPPPGPSAADAEARLKAEADRNAAAEKAEADRNAAAEKAEAERNAAANPVAAGPVPSPVPSGSV